MKTTIATLALVIFFGCQISGYASSDIVFSTLDVSSPSFWDLRHAIAYMNKRGGNNTITLYRGPYHLINEDSINVGDLDITNGNLTIKGQCGSPVMIDASDASLLGNRVFHIWPGAHLTLVNIGITGGRQFFGGGIWNEGTLTLDNCLVTGNSCDVGDGGGIYNTGTLTVSNCTIRGNSAGAGNNSIVFLGGSGGVVYITFPLPMPGGNGGNGGGVCNLGTLNMNNSIVAGNSAGSGQVGSGGGSGGSGGGVYNAGNLKLSNCLVRDNSCGAAGNGVNGIPAGNGGNGGSGGGIFNSGQALNATLNATLVTSNIAGQGGSGGVIPDGSTGTGGSPGLDGSGPNLFGNFTLINRRGTW
jgi:hypothetical protein